MKHILLIAGAAALVGTAPAVAKPGGGHGNGHSNAHASMTHGPKAHSKSRVTHSHRSATRLLRDRNRNRIDDRDEALARKYGGALCPPGLWKKTPSCMPPGQAKRLFREGQRVTSNYRYFTPYSDIPLALRNQYNLSDQNRYIYRNNVIYEVDPTTRLVTDIINAVL